MENGIENGGLVKSQNGRLKYAEFLDELLQAKGLKKSELAKSLSVPESSVYEFFEGRHCPNAALAKAVEFALGVNLRPEYYGFGEVTKP